MVKPGTRLGSYEVVALVGAGGMGEVYRARDVRLQRDVAIKILPEVFAADPERLARFDREARTLAALNHPNIAQVYGAEGGALIMEFVEGDDLAARIARSGAIPLDDAIPIALQIAEALECAHEAGIIHRDLKPANVKVRPDGTVKVLDFGLAKALEPAHAGVAHEATNSPTITSPFAMSNLGVILGTAAYMAPEQARGKPLDKRVDVWAFGCLLYEMLTARRAFAGEDVTDTLAAIVRADPDWSALPADTPPAIRTLLRRCLEKDRRERLPDMGAARLELKDVRTGARQTGSGSGSHAASVPAPGRAHAWLPWVVAAAAIAFASINYGVSSRTTPDAPPAKLSIVPPSALTVAPALRFNVSPDGRQLAFVAPDTSGNTMLWVRRLDSDTAQPLAGTARASAPFWSPDSRSIAFIASGKLRRIDAAGGPVVTISNAIDGPPGTWSREDEIVFSGFRGPLTALARVSARGPGQPRPLTSLGSSTGNIQILPSFLPDGRHFLYTTSTRGPSLAGIYVGSIDGGADLLLEGVAHAIYASGYLLFLRDTTLLAQPFDPDARKLSGTAVPLATDIQINGATGTGAFSVSQNGVLVYQAGPSSGTRLIWVDRSGKPVGGLGDRSGYQDVRLSPDGRTVSVTLSEERGLRSDVYLFDLVRGVAPRLTFGARPSLDGVWTPNGRLVYAAQRSKLTHDLFQRAATGSGQEETVYVDDADKYPLCVTPDGKFLLYEVPNGAATGHAWLLPLSGDRTPRPFNQSMESEVPAEVSPNGRWVAFVGADQGRRDVFVTSFPDATGRWQVSIDGGETPHWSADGKSLYFIAPDGLYAATAATTGAQFSNERPQRLFDVRVPTPALGTRSTYAVSNDGSRFLVNMWDPKAPVTPLTVVLNWPSTIRR